MSQVTAQPMISVSFENLKEKVEGLMKEQLVESLLGSHLTTQGVLLLFFSPHFNQETCLLVNSMDLPRVLEKVSSII